MNSQQQKETVTKNNLLTVVFFETAANMTTMYSEHSQKLKRSRLQKKVSTWLLF